MKPVKYSEIKDGEIFLNYCDLSNRKSITILKKIEHNCHEQLMTWDMEQYHGNRFVWSNYDKKKTFFLTRHMGENLDDRLVCFRLTDAEVKNVLLETI